MVAWAPTWPALVSTCPQPHPQGEKSSQTLPQPWLAAGDGKCSEAWSSLQDKGTSDICVCLECVDCELQASYFLCLPVLSASSARPCRRGEAIHCGPGSKRVVDLTLSGGTVL